VASEIVYTLVPATLGLVLFVLLRSALPSWAVLTFTVTTAAGQILTTRPFRTWSKFGYSRQNGESLEESGVLGYVLAVDCVGRMARDVDYLSIGRLIDC
jgi:hypothetical protein